MVRLSLFSEWLGIHWTTPPWDGMPYDFCSTHTSHLFFRGPPCPLGLHTDSSKSIPATNAMDLSFHKNKLVLTLTLEEWEHLHFKGSYWEPFKPHLQSPCRKLLRDSSFFLTLFISHPEAASSLQGYISLSSGKPAFIPSCPSTGSRCLGWEDLRP